MILIVWIFVASAVSSSTGSHHLCQISLDCSQPLTAAMVRCLEPFRSRWMVPLIRPGIPTNNGKHLLDLYVNSTDDPRCGTLGVVAEVAENGTVAVNLVVGCRSFASLPMFSLSYATDNRSTLMPCGRSMAGRLTEHLWDCRIIRSELLRLTVISNNTVLVEDLSTQVPPGTRVFFRIQLMAQNLFGHYRCRCKNYNQHLGQHLDKCRTRRPVSKSDNSTVELVVAVTLIVMQWLGVILGKIWFMRGEASCKVPALKRN